MLQPCIKIMAQAKNIGDRLFENVHFLKFPTTI
jgi:hypothetical protein